MSTHQLQVFNDGVGFEPMSYESELAARHGWVEWVWALGLEELRPGSGIYQPRLAATLNHGIYTFTITPCHDGFDSD